MLYFTYIILYIGTNNGDPDVEVSSNTIHNKMFRPEMKDQSTTTRDTNFSNDIYDDVYNDHKRKMNRDIDHDTDRDLDHDTDRDKNLDSISRNIYVDGYHDAGKNSDGRNDNKHDVIRDNVSEIHSVSNRISDNDRDMNRDVYRDKGEVSERNETDNGNVTGAKGEFADKSLLGGPVVYLMCNIYFTCLYCCFFTNNHF